MARKKHKHEEHVDESWLVPYSDMLTLLMALFMVLFAMSSIDAGKFNQLAISLNSEFAGGTGEENFLTNIDPGKTDELMEAFSEKMMVEQLKNQEDAKSAEMEDLLEVKKKIDEYIKANNLALVLETTLDEKGLMITIKDNALFDSGESIIKADSEKLAEEIGKLLVSKKPRNVLVEGHTDNVPITNANFRSNWELSVSRSVNFMKVLLHNDSLNPSLFSAVGHGEYKPKEKNDTPVGKSKNRRVEILIQPYLGDTKEVTQ